jgi:Ni2+-binding GTPase involved in maturation of urease and hydrogenase
MKLVTIAGTPSCGKSSIAIHLAKDLQASGVKVAAVKYDCISSQDAELYASAGVAVTTALAGGLCPDHFFASSVEDACAWAKGKEAGVLVIESAGLCCRCSPHVKGVLAICVIDALSGVNTPRKIGPMLRTADIVAITKGDIVSQAEREVFAFRVRRANPSAKIVLANGLTGQGVAPLANAIRIAPEPESLAGMALRFTMPAALCSYCLGERRIGHDYQIGNAKPFAG